MTPAKRSITDQEARLLERALREPRGSYRAERASQLSGVPLRTVHHWAKEELMVPDWADERPKRWSYRDLVFLRIFVWLRAKGMPPVMTAARVEAVRRSLDDPNIPIGLLRSQGAALFIGDESFDRASGEQVFTTVRDFMSEFDVMTTIDPSELGAHRLWGPDLVRPASKLSISPWVMAGEPCIVDTRILTASMFALHRERNLEPSRIVNLYPGLEPAAVEEALYFEGRVRHMSVAA